MRPPSLDDFIYTDEHIDIIHAANDVESLLKHPGWAHITTFMNGLVQVAQEQARVADTSNFNHAIEKLREWQNKNDFYSQIGIYIQSLIQKRDELAPKSDLEALLLKEQLNARSTTDGDTQRTV